MKEQCWLNETLSAYEWIPEGLENGPIATNMEDDEANEEDLQAVLTGRSSKFTAEVALTGTLQDRSLHAGSQ